MKSGAYGSETNTVQDNPTTALFARFESKGFGVDNWMNDSVAMDAPVRSELSLPADRSSSPIAFFPDRASNLSAIGVTK